MELDPIIAAYLADLRARGIPPAQDTPVEAARGMYTMRTHLMNQREAPPELAQVHDVLIPGPGGDIPARVYRPRVDEPLPTVLYVHGGGWVLCDIESHDPVCRRLAVLADAVIVSIDYRLAPEHPFPAAHEDTVAAYDWVRAQRGELGGSTVWGAAGDSAGANMTSAAIHLGRATIAPADAPAAHLCFYPAMDLTTRYPSMDRFGTGYGLEEPTLDYFLAQYAAAADPADPRLSPLRFESHEGMPPTIVVTAGHDPFHDEGVAYVEALRAAGVTAHHQDAPGLIHGFVDLGPMVPAAAEALTRAGTRFGELLRGIPATS
jgi:acetyl esterase